MSKNTARIELADGRVLILVPALDFDEEVDLNKLMRIDMFNLGLELVTMPLILNEVGLLLAEANSRVSAAKLEFEIYCAKTKDEIREKYAEEGHSKPLSNDRADEKLAKMGNYVAKRTIYNKRIMEAEMLNSLYWALKSKDEKINKLSLNLQAGDIEQELVNSRLRRFNYVDVKDLKRNTHTAGEE